MEVDFNDYIIQENQTKTAGSIFRADKTFLGNFFGNYNQIQKIQPVKEEYIEELLSVLDAYAYPVHQILTMVEEARIIKERMTK